MILLAVITTLLTLFSISQFIFVCYQYLRIKKLVAKVDDLKDAYGRNFAEMDLVRSELIKTNDRLEEILKSPDKKSKNKIDEVDEEGLRVDESFTVPIKDGIKLILDNGKEMPIKIFPYKSN